ncbi:MAG: BatA domain-containing protein [Bacteroidota bacterium]|nr:BatA domain-containing protein [Bacteroidota bacterium]
MQFVHPEYLWGLLTLIIPILIHLFHFRKYRTLYFSDIRNIQNLERETRKQRRLKHYLILLARLIFLTFLTFAFARPVSDQDVRSDEENSTVNIFIDNGPMSSEDNGRGSMLLQMQSRAGQIIQSYPSRQRFRIMTRDHALPSREGVDGSEALDIIAGTRPSFSSIDPSFIGKRLKNLDGIQKLFVISSFITSSESDWAELADSSLNVHSFPIASPSTLLHLSVDSIWFGIPIFRPGIQQELKIRYSYSGRDLPDSLRLRVGYHENDTLKGLTNLSISEAGSGIITLRTTLGSSGWKKARVEFISSERTLAQAYFGFWIREGSSTLLLEGSPISERIESILDDEYNSLLINRMDQPSLLDIKRSSQVVLYEPPTLSSGLAGTLADAVDQGQTLMIIPPQDEDETNSLLRALGLNLEVKRDTQNVRMGRIQDSDPFWSGAFLRGTAQADLPQINTYYRLTKPSSGIPLITFLDGAPAALRIPFGKGQILLGLFPITENPDFLAHNLAIPFFYQGNLLSNSNPVKAVVLGSSDRIFFDLDQEQEDAVRLRSESGEEWIPTQITNEKGVFIEVGNLMLEPGIYQVVATKGSIGFLGINPSPTIILSEMEGDLAVDDRYYQSSGVDVESVKASIQKENEGDQLWKLCVIFAILFLLAESLISRFLK